MINLLYDPLPESISADGEEYAIITDFQEWFLFADMIHDNKLSNDDKIILMAEYLINPPELITSAIVKAVFDFYAAKALSPKSPDNDDENKNRKAPQRPVFDWKYDGKYVLADFRRYYGIDLLIAEMHWWEFRSLFAALPDDSMCQKRISYRSINLGKIKNNKERARIARIQHDIALPFECDDEAIAVALGGIG